MALTLDVLSWLALISGSCFCLIAAIGMHRFPDFYTRIHAAGITDTLGAGLILLGLFFQAPTWNVAVKLAMVAIFLWLTSPTATHAVAQAAHANGLRPLLGDAPNPFESEAKEVRP